MTFRQFLFTSTIILAGPALSATSVHANPIPPEPRLSQTHNLESIRINDAESGTLMFRTQTPGQFIKAPMVATDVDMNIAGPVIRTTLSQTFENTTDDWVEGIYVFPLPENAAVDRLRMVIGGRMIEGQIKEKVQAKRIYEQAKAEGKKASLVEQQRPNLFTASVANIGPNETVAIQIEYQDKAQIKDSVFAMRLPLTVAPRYSPPVEAVTVATTGGLQDIVFDPVLDRKAISPPFKNPTQEPIEYLRLPVSLNINLDAGFKIADIDSAYHDIVTSKIDDDSVQINLKDGAIPANRDFLLEWRAQDTREPYSSVFKQTVGDETYLLSMLTPPTADAADIPTRARESIFVIDTSGSMNGTSIIQARNSLSLALDKLRPEDTFNIIRFSSDFSSLNAEPMQATKENIRKAKRWVSRLNADGGTEMSPALAEALSPKSEDRSRLRQVIFITDGSIGNEQQLFAQIQDELGDTRLFPVGIGSAPNSFFMSRAAKFGRGTYVQIGDVSEVTKRMESLLKSIQSPVLTDIKSSVTGASFPARMPDVYQGDPVISIARMKTKDLPDSFSISGNIAGQNWEQSKALSDAEDAEGLSVLWARAKIADLEESRFDRAGAAKIDAEILQTALDHHIVSRLTSLVAVDVTQSRPNGTALNKANVPTMLPDGWEFGKSAMRETKRKKSSSSYGASSSTAAPQQSLRLPNTASPHEVLGILGALFMLLGMGLKRRTRQRET